MVLIFAGGIVNRTYGINKHPYISPFLLTIFGPINCGSPVIVACWINVMHQRLCQVVSCPYLSAAYSNKASSGCPTNRLKTTAWLDDQQNCAAKGLDLKNWQLKTSQPEVKRCREKQVNRSACTPPRLTLLFPPLLNSHQFIAINSLLASKAPLNTASQPCYTSSSVRPSCEKHSPARREASKDRRHSGGSHRQTICGQPPLDNLIAVISRRPTKYGSHPRTT